MLSVITDILWIVVLNINKTQVTRLYVITDILLKVALSNNKTGNHVIPYKSHIVESGVKHQYNLPWYYTL